MNPHSQVSSHYVVGRDGVIVQMVAEDQVAYHAGANNADSIGIELVNNGDGNDPFPPEQLSALTYLTRRLIVRYGISAEHILAHSQVDNGTIRIGRRRVKSNQDPGPLFPWNEFRKAVQRL